MISIFDENYWNVKKLKKQAMKIEELQDKYKAMSDAELIANTDIFKEQIKNGAKLDDILVDAFAVCREACDRVLGMRPFFVQLMGGIALHQGRISEMGTGEGKTLVAVLPSYLNALTGHGVHVVTVNDYLAARDASWMGKVHRFLGLSVGVVLPNMPREQKVQAYNSDITYCTNTELGFDFLRDNMAVRKQDKVQRELNFAIIDEVDSILIDEARTPLIISARGDKSVQEYKSADALAKKLKEGRDFEIQEKEKTVVLTEEGIEEAERFYRLDNLTDLDNTDTYHHILQALRANYMMKRDKDYIVSDGEVLIVDEFTGRVMIGRRYSEGLHQAIEAKEHVVIRSEDKTVATITYQNFFRMYKKLSGMTGTAKTEEEEFKGIYSLDVVTIPPNKPSQRIDENDQIYTTLGGKNAAVVRDIEEHHKNGQPILVGTVSVDKSEELSRILKRKGIIHNVLNAKLHKQESEIIAQAGRFNAVTIATNMAGRGTDIMLGGNPDFQAKQKLEKDGYTLDVIEAASSPHDYQDEEIIKAKAEYNRIYAEAKKICEEEKEKVIKAGGLRIIGTERHESRRIDNQLRGRSGRQGDIGSTVFYISLEDDIARIFGGDKLKNMNIISTFDKDTPIANPIITKQIEKAQRSIEARNFAIRKQVLSYDDVINTQRELIYKERGKVLDGLDISEQIEDMIDDLAENVISTYADYKTDYQTWDYEAFNKALEAQLLPENSNLMNIELCSCFDVYKLKKAVMDIVLPAYNAKKEEAKKYGIDFQEVERVVLLRNVDSKWMDHIDAMDVLRRGIGLRGYGQRDPIVAYREEGFEMFEDMVDRIHVDTAKQLLSIKLEFEEDAQNKQNGEKPSAVKLRRHVEKAVTKTVHSDKKIGRNDPCPCGSGLKYKNCCGKNK